MTVSKLIRAGVTVGGLLLLAACSSIVEGTTQSITVTTDPAGAMCELQREGTTIAVVDPTPGTVQVDKSKQHIAINCTKDEHEPAAGTLASTFEGMTFGNILFGGIVGVAIDASSGAINKYPPSIELFLPPVSFASAEARDTYYDNLIARIRKESEKEIKKVVSSCGSPESDECKSSVELLEKSRDSQISDLEAKRARARIEG